MSGTISAADREQLVRRALDEFEGALIGYATSILRDRERARDAAQDTFIKLYGQDPERVEGGLKPWLFAVCRNRCRDILRKEKRMTELDEQQAAALPDESADPSGDAERREQHGEVLRFLERLPENQREVIRLKFQGEMSYKEIAEVTQLSVSNVGFLIHAGIKRLRGLMSHQIA